MTEILKAAASSPGGVGILLATAIGGIWMFIRVATMFGWITIASQQADNTDFTGKLKGEEVQYQDLVKHCGAQQALVKKEIKDLFATTLENLNKSLERGERSFERIDAKLDKFGDRLARMETSVTDMKENKG